MCCPSTDPYGTPSTGATCSVVRHQRDCSPERRQPLQRRSVSTWPHALSHVTVKLLCLTILGVDTASLHETTTAFGRWRHRQSFSLGSYGAQRLATRNFYTGLYFDMSSVPTQTHFLSTAAVLITAAV